MHSIGPPAGSGNSAACGIARKALLGYPSLKGFRIKKGLPTMADHGEIQYSTAEGNDLPAHEATYEMFLAMFKWGTIFVIVLLILMAYFLI
jgi:hypothetical protein